ncbi:MAG TPA: bifunctional riboflavin kinase/FAD synthetase [Thermoanaerobaculia bacterium]|jgi:riboflavin kinase/FMN adenylyltransferase|nr:bifunctional riboflavin kinase/FAD synthetase [Thermoanaerobaculia bacterium]
MHVFQDAYNASDLPRGGVGTIGNFDGVHRGQRAILDRVVARAEELRVPPVVVTFDPHPMTVLAPERTPIPLTTPKQKEKLLEEAGVAVMLVVRFTPELSRVPARAFVRELLHDKLDLKEIYVGSGFVFGHKREGDLALLQEMGRELGFTAAGVEEVVYGGERISSTRIRRAVSEGKVTEAAEMLGRPYSLAGVIARGDRMGKRLGWPTINLMTDNKLLPADGVYASRVFFPSYPATFDCVTNIGTRPTVYENYQRVVESHILDFKADVYGQKIELEFYKRLREERIFPNVMDLSAQIRRDVDATRDYFFRRRLEQEAPSAALEGE